MVPVCGKIVLIRCHCRWHIPPSEVIMLVRWCDCGRNISMLAGIGLTSWSNCWRNSRFVGRYSVNQVLWLQVEHSLTGLSVSLGWPAATRRLRTRRRTPSVCSETKSPTAPYPRSRFQWNQTEPAVTGSWSCLSSGRWPSSPDVASSPSTSPSLITWARWCMQVSVLLLLLLLCHGKV